MRIRTPRDIGILIKEARRRQGMSQAALARRINSTQTWVSWIENGKTTAEIGGVLLALTTLGVELDFKLPEAARPTGPEDSPRSVDAPHAKEDEDAPPYTL